MGTPAEVSAASLRSLRTAALVAVPNEACGLLSGRPGPAGQGGWVVEAVYPMVNRAASPERQFQLDPVELRRVILAIEAGGSTVAGVFHSHPRGPAVPSATDVAAAGLLPDGWVHLVIGQLSVGAPRSAPEEVRAWRLAAGRAEEVELRVSAPGLGH